MLDQLIARHKATAERVAEKSTFLRGDVSASDAPEAAAYSSQFVSDAEGEGPRFQEDDAETSDLDDWTPPEPPSWL